MTAALNAQAKRQAKAAYTKLRFNDKADKDYARQPGSHPQSFRQAVAFSDTPTVSGPILKLIKPVRLRSGERTAACEEPAVRK